MKEAPKAVKLWVQIIDNDVRAKVVAMIGRLHPNLWTDLSHGRKLATAQYLGYAYVPVVRWAYNIYNKVAAQTLRIPSPSGEYTVGGYGVQTASVAVRESSSWGEDELE